MTRKWVWPGSGCGQLLYTCHYVIAGSIRLLKEMLIFCKEKSTEEDRYKQLESFVLCGSPSKTVYLIEVLIIYYYYCYYYYYYYYY